VGPHRDGNLHQRVDRIDPRGGRFEAQHRGQQRRAIGEAGGPIVHHLDLVALQHRHVDELTGLLAMAVLHHQQPGAGHFEHEAEVGDRPGRPPDAELAVHPPHAEMDAGALHRRRDLRQRSGGERERLLEEHGIDGLVRGQERERNLREVDLLAPQAGPEGRVDDRLDGIRVRAERDPWILRAPLVQVLREVRLYPRRDESCGRIRSWWHRGVPVLSISGDLLI
jgi:hypothetical protein